MAATEAMAPKFGLNQFFSAWDARIDRWRTLNRITRNLAARGAQNGNELRQEAIAVLEELHPIEELNAYPGPHLIAQVQERLANGDWVGLERIVQRISSALLSNSYRDNREAWIIEDEGESHLPDFLPPSARGKSVFKSNWIRDMGEFYGANLFLAESCATTGGLDSLLEPTGNIKQAQEKAARAFGGDRAFFVTNGTSTANKIVHQALLTPGDIVLIDRDCHKSHHYGIVLAGALPLYIDAYPLTQYSMYGSLAIRPIKQALLALKAEGKLDRAKMLVLTNCTFDGHIANVEQTMLECLAIKPDLVFLWNEAWFGFARFSPLLRMRTAMGGAAKLRELIHDPLYRDKYEAFKDSLDGIGDTDLRLLDMPLLPDPDQIKVPVYETESIHKSMSSLRQGSIIVVADQEFHTVEAQFKEAFFTHTSTSPNLQIIASIDVARRQMELEGYELVQRALQLAMEIRKEINNHPLISKYFHAATPAEMIPPEYRVTGFSDYGMPGSTVTDATQALRKDEFFLDPTRITLLCGNAGYDGTRFKGLLAETYDIQINKTSRNSVLVQINISNTRIDMVHLIKTLADISRALERELDIGGDGARASFKARVKGLVEDVPELPDFSRFHNALRENSESATPEGDMRAAYYFAYNAQACECIGLYDARVDERLKNGPELVSAKFVIPYPPSSQSWSLGKLSRRKPLHSCASWMSRRFTDTTRRVASSCSSPKPWQLSGEKQDDLFPAFAVGIHQESLRWTTAGAEAPVLTYP